MSVRLILFFLFILPSCTYESLEVLPEQVKYLTENVIIVTIDGPRFSETWDSASKNNIPFQSLLSSSGVFFNNFFNLGSTSTTAGHTAITTGVYQQINNTGKELPANPSVFQYFLNDRGFNSDSAWIIASKHKLEVLSNSSHPDWNNKSRPSVNTGTNGLGSQNRNDKETLQTAFDILIEHHPKLALIQFKEPDGSAHANNWDAYIQGIKDTDEYVWELWNFIQQDPIYQNKTALFVTNDHGRHLDEIANGFISHGDDCLGCRHISLLALGPDFKSGIVTDKNYDQTNISATIAELFGLNLLQGDIIEELFIKF